MEVKYYPVKTIKIIAISAFAFGLAVGSQLNHRTEYIEVEAEPVLASIEPVKKFPKYVERFKETAIMEQKKYGIPAAISMAQAILESGWGDGYLAKKANNHFGIKCFSKGCKEKHCIYAFDSGKKFRFIKYETAWESWRAHSLFLLRPNYEELFSLDIDDLEGWAKGLERRGYATGRGYAKKIMSIIKKYDLEKLQQ